MKSYTIQGVIQSIVNIPDHNNYGRTFKQRITVIDEAGHLYRGTKSQDLVGATVGSVVQFLADIRPHLDSDIKFVFVRPRNGAILS
jgi:hypothetical protein